MRFSAFIFIFAFVTSSIALAAPAVVKAVAIVKPVPIAAVTVKSFKTWKAEKIQQAQAQVDQTRLQLRLMRSRSQSSAQLVSVVQSLNQQLAQEEWNLEVAADLAVTDYLVLYLAQQGSPMQMTEAASKLTPVETAQVLEAYIRAMGAHPNIEGKPLLPVSTLNGR